jgi:hypothetical protein
MVSAPSSSLVRKRTASGHQKTIWDKSIKPVTTSLIMKSVASVFARYSLPHHLVDKEDIKEMFSLFRMGICPLPSKRQLRQHQKELAIDLRGKVVTRLLEHAKSSPVSIAIDGWTNVRSHKITNVVCLCGGTAYYWCSIVNANNANSASWLSKPLLDVMSGIKGLGVAIVGIVADNEELNKALYKRLLPSFPFLVLSPCGAHVINLCVQRSLELPGIHETMVTMAETINQFCSCKEYRQRLMALQRASGVSEPLTLRKPNATRWSSHLYAAQRLRQLQTWVQLIVPQTEGFWSSLGSIVDFLQPFQVATDVIQSDSSTIYTSHQQMEKLIRELPSIPSTSCFFTLRDVVKDIILHHWKKFMPISAIVQCSVLSFDDSGQFQFTGNQIAEARNWFMDFGVDYINKYHLSFHETPALIRRALGQQYSDFLGGVGTFSTMGDDVRGFRAGQAADSSRTSSAVRYGVNVQHRFGRWDPKSAWFMHLNTAPELCKAAIALLSVAGSEAAVERTFSAQDMVHNRRRNRLLDSAVEQEMFIRFNTDALQDESKRPAGQLFVELTEDGDVEADSTRQVKELFAFFSELRWPAGSDEKKNDEADEQAMDLAEAEAEVDNAINDSAAIQMEAELPVPEDITERFITYFIAKHGLVAGVRWLEHRMNTLQQEAITFTPPVKDTVDDLKNKINARLRSQ